jgi:hypothetical protein
MPATFGQAKTSHLFGAIDLYFGGMGVLVLWRDEKPRSTLKVPLVVFLKNGLRCRSAPSSSSHLTAHLEGIHA